MSPITTHVLDTALGRPAEGIAVTLEIRSGAGWTVLARGTTNADGRIRDWIAEGASLAAGVYRLTFATGAYFARLGSPEFYPEVPVLFHYDSRAGHYHVPLLLSPFGYSTYRGS